MPLAVVPATMENLNEMAELEGVLIAVVVVVVSFCRILRSRHQRRVTIWTLASCALRMMRATMAGP